MSELIFLLDARPAGRAGAGPGQAGGCAAAGCGAAAAAAGGCGGGGGRGHDGGGQDSCGQGSTSNPNNLVDSKSHKTTGCRNAHSSELTQATHAIIFKTNKSHTEPLLSGSSIIAAHGKRGADVLNLLVDVFVY